MKSKVQHYIIAGVSGSGKTTVGQLLSIKLAIPFYDADDFHTKANMEKMKAGKPLNDIDRLPWLYQLNNLLKNKTSGCILACSALKQSYRDALKQNLHQKIHWIFLQGNYHLILNRMNKRNHFMPPALLQSQFDTFEEPNYGVKISVNKKVEEIVEEIINKTNEK